MRILQKMAALLAGLAKELADENAYRRYLAAKGKEASGEEWRLFSDARLRRKYQNGRCC